MRSVVLLVILLSGGCAHSTLSSSDVAQLPGLYQSGDGFWPRWLDLKEDGTYSYTQITDVLRDAGDGTSIFEGGWGLTGTWTFRPPDRIEMSTNGKPARLSVVVRRSAKYGFAILEPGLFPDILSRWKDDGSWGYLKKQKPEETIPPVQRTGADARR